jgi:protease-4
VSALKTAFEEKSAQAVVLRMNSPGGSPVQAGIVNDEIKRLKAQHKKKLYVVVEEVCASGAYYIAVAADEIYTDKASIVGLDRRADGRLRLRRRHGQAGHRAAPAHRRREQGHERPVLAGDREAEGLHAGDARPDPQAVHPRRQGRPRQAAEGDARDVLGPLLERRGAVKQGLADKFGNLDYVAREVVKAEEIVDYTPRRTSPSARQALRHVDRRRSDAGLQGFGALR